MITEHLHLQLRTTVKPGHNFSTGIWADAFEALERDNEEDCGYIKYLWGKVIEMYTEFPYPSPSSTNPAAVAELDMAPAAPVTMGLLNFDEIPRRPRGAALWLGCKKPGPGCSTPYSLAMLRLEMHWGVAKLLRAAMHHRKDSGEPYEERTPVCAFCCYMFDPSGISCVVIEHISF